MCALKKAERCNPLEPLPIEAQLDHNEIYAEVVARFLTDLIERVPIANLLSAETIESLNNGALPDRLTFDRAALADALLGLVEDYLQECITVNLDSPPSTNSEQTIEPLSNP